MRLTLLDTHGATLDAFRPITKRGGTRVGLASAARRWELRDLVNLGIFGADTGYGAHEALNHAAPVIVMITDNGEAREYADWALAASPAARAENYVRRMYGAGR